MCYRLSGGILCWARSRHGYLRRDVGKRVYFGLFRVLLEYLAKKELASRAYTGSLMRVYTLMVDSGTCNSEEKYDVGRRWHECFLRVLFHA